MDTVGGLLAQRLGKVPLPGAEAEVAGLRLLAEGGKDARGRIRITTVLVEPLDPEARRRVDAAARTPATRTMRWTGRAPTAPTAEESDARCR